MSREFCLGNSDFVPVWPAAEPRDKTETCLVDAVELRCSDTFEEFTEDCLLVICGVPPMEDLLGRGPMLVMASVESWLGALLEADATAGVVAGDRAGVPFAP